MILPNQIQDHEFTYAKGMYKASEVDEFLKEVAGSFDQTFRENGELVKKLQILADKVEEYRNDEDNIRVALIAAQRAANQLTKDAKQKSDETISNAQSVANDTLTTANNKADEIIAKAKADAELMIKDANAQAAQIEAEYQRNKKIEDVALEAIKKDSSKFKSELLSMYNTHIALINEIPALVMAEAQNLEAEEAETETEEVVVEEEITEMPEEFFQEEDYEEKFEEVEEVEEEPEEIEESQYFEEEPVQTVVAAEKKEADYDFDDFEETEEDEEEIPQEEAQQVSEGNTAIPRKQSFEEAFAAFFSDDDDEEEDFSELEDLDNDVDLSEDFDEKDFDMFSDDDDDAEEPADKDGKKGFGRLFKKK